MLTRCLCNARWQNKSCDAAYRYSLSFSCQAVSFSACLPAGLSACLSWFPAPIQPTQKAAAVHQLYRTAFVHWPYPLVIPWPFTGHTHILTHILPACLPARLPRNQALLGHRSCQAMPAKPPRQPRFLIPQHPGYSASGLQHGTSRPRCNQRYACQNHALDKTPRETW